MSALMGDENVGKLEEAAQKRREKLKALRKHREQGSTANAVKNNKDELPLPELKLRNYQPTSEELQDISVEKAAPGSVEDHIKDQLQSQQPDPTVADEVDLLNLAPRKPDWDLKRDIKAKLDKLERRTQRAIAEIIRERLKESTQNDPSHFSEVPDAPQEGYESD